MGTTVSPFLPAKQLRCGPQVERSYTLWLHGALGSSNSWLKRFQHRRGHQLSAVPVPQTRPTWRPHRLARACVLVSGHLALFGFASSLASPQALARQGFSAANRQALRGNLSQPFCSHRRSITKLVVDTHPCSTPSGLRSPQLYRRPHSPSLWRRQRCRLPNRSPAARRRRLYQRCGLLISVRVGEAAHPGPPVPASPTAAGPLADQPHLLGPDPPRRI